MHRVAKIHERDQQPTTSRRGLSQYAPFIMPARRKIIKEFELYFNNFIKILKHVAYFSQV